MEADLDSLTDYYKILKCERTASSEELKRSYQRLVLTVHPDKAEATSSNDKYFLLLQKAWSVLRDPESRKHYDAELSCKEHTECLLYDTISLSDLNCVSSDVYSYPCRCGGNYVLENEHLAQDSIVIPCDECSFSVLVNR